MGLKSSIIAAAMFAVALAISGPASATVVFSTGTFKLFGGSGSGIDDVETFSVDASLFTGLSISFNWRTFCETGCEDMTEDSDRFFASADGIDFHPAGGFEMGGAIQATPGNPGPWQSVAQSIGALDGTVFDLVFQIATSTAGENIKVSNLVIAGQHVDVPEPGALALFGFGLAGLGFVAWRRRDA